MQGKIVKIISNHFTVEKDNHLYDCMASGNLRKMKNIPLAGDYVEFDENKKFITKILPRRNALVRPPVSNVDNAFIVNSVYIPAFSSNLLYKLLCIIEYNNIKPIICFSKLDMLSNKELEEINVYINYYRKIGYDVYLNNEIDQIKKVFKDKITVFTGQTGAGKSTLLNKLDSKLNLKTDDVSYALGRGKHTTRHVELIPMLDGLVADTPGFSSLEFYDMSKESIRDNFIEFNMYREHCKYKDCMHDLEDECYIKKLVDDGVILKSRYENYINFIKRV